MNYQSSLGLHVQVIFCGGGGGGVCVFKNLYSVKRKVFFQYRSYNIITTHKYYMGWFRSGPDCGHIWWIQRSIPNGPFRFLYENMQFLGLGWNRTTLPLALFRAQSDTDVPWLCVYCFRLCFAYKIPYKRGKRKFMPNEYKIRVAKEHALCSIFYFSIRIEVDCT